MLERSFTDLTGLSDPAVAGREPFISVIIATYQRPRILRGCLEALSRSDYPRDRFEVLAVDDGGTVDLGFVPEFRDRMDVTLLRSRHGGPALARNVGLARAKGEFVAFTDDDCLVDRG